MSQTVFVIHGVKNHVEEKFEETVEGLQQLVTGVTLLPVFWGNLGANDEYLDRVIPSSSDTADASIAAAESVPTPDGVAPVETLLLAGEVPAVDAVPSPNVDGRALIAHEAGQGPGPMTADAWRSVLDDVWDETPYLRSISDEVLLRRLGEALAQDESGVAGRSLDRDDAQPEGSFAAQESAFDRARQRLRDMNRAVAAVIGSVAGKVNESLRTKMGPDIAEFAGDIAVYQRNQIAIQDCVREKVHAAGYGTSDKPASFIAHSLGGVITLDMCVAQSDPLHVNGLVTFGSQWPFFQLVDPRLPGADYDGIEPMTLPGTLSGRWVNLWEPLDPLAFVAAHVLRLADGSEPDDRQAAYRLASGLWTHSAYWGLPELVTAISDVFGEG